MERKTQDLFGVKTSDLLNEWCETLQEVSETDSFDFTNEEILNLLAASRHITRQVVGLEVEVERLRQRQQPPCQTMNDIKNALQAEGSNVMLFPMVPRDGHVDPTPKGAA